MTQKAISIQSYMVFWTLTLACGFGNCAQTAMNSLLNEICVEYATSLEIGQWLSTAYILALGVSVPLSVFVQRRFSERVLLLSALVLAAIGSLLIIVSPQYAIALLGRIMQACGTGLLLPAIQTLIMTDFPRERMGFYMGVMGVAMGFCSNVGPTIAGIMDALWGWKSFFWLYFGLAVVLIVISFCFGRKESEQPNLKFDYASFALCSVAFVALLLGISNAASLPLGHVFVWCPVIAGIFLLVVFIKKQLTLKTPFISMDIFKSEKYVVGFFALISLFASFVGAMLIIPQYIENLRGGSALDAGMVLLPAAVAAFIANLASGIAMDKFGCRKTLLTTGIFLAIGSVLCCFCDEDTPLMFLVIAQVIRTFGVSGSIGPLTGYSMLDLKRVVLADGSAFSTLTRQAAASLGTSLYVFLIAWFNAQGVCAFAYQIAFVFSAIFACIVFALIVCKVRE